MDPVADALPAFPNHFRFSTSGLYGSVLRRHRCDDAAEVPVARPQTAALNPVSAAFDQDIAPLVGPNVTTYGSGKRSDAEA